MALKKGLTPLFDQTQEQVLFPPREVNELAILHFDLPPVPADIPLDIMQIDDERMMRPEKTVRRQKLFEFF